MLDTDLLSVELISGKNISEIFESYEGIVFFVIPNFVDVISEIELKYIQNHYSSFKKMKWEIIIITVDTKEEIDLYKSNSNPKFTIHRDSNLDLCNSLGIIGEDDLPLRRTLIVDNKQTIRRMFKHIMPKEHPQEIINWIELNSHQSMTILQNGIDNNNQ